MTTKNFSIEYDAKITLREDDGDEVERFFSTVGRVDTTYAIIGGSTAELSGRLKQPLQFSQTMYGERKTRGQKEISTGSVVLENSDGGLDDLIDYAFDGGEFYLSIFSMVDGRSANISGAGITNYAEDADITENSITLFVRDANYLLNKPALQNFYGGTNALPAGVDGTPDDIGGQRIPIALGINPNITPYFVNTSRLIYQLCDQSIGFLTGYSLTVYDQGIALVQDGAGDYASEAAMQATAPAAGQYRIWPAGGMFRLGSAPTGKVTCDLTNPVNTIGTTTPTPVTRNEVHTVMNKVARLCFGTTGGCNASGLADVPDVGVYITGDVTFLDVLRKLGASVNATFNCGLGRTGASITIDQLVDPSGDTSVDTLNEGQIYKLQRVRTSDEDRGKPVHRVTVKYKLNNTVMSDGELAGAVTQARRAFLAQQWREVYSEDAAVLTKYPDAPEIVCESLIDTEADAQAEADRLQALYGVERAMYIVDTHVRAMLDSSTKYAIGGTITVTYPRFGLDAGVKLHIVGRALDLANNRVTLTLWG